MHGVSLSIGSTDPLDRDYLGEADGARRRGRARVWVSDHLCWTGVAGRNSHDLLPMPVHRGGAAPRRARASARCRTSSSGRSCSRTRRSYVRVPAARRCREWEFLGRLAEEADCGLLLDVNNVYVSSSSTTASTPGAYIRAIPPPSASCSSTSPATPTAARTSSTRTTGAVDRSRLGALPPRPGAHGRRVDAARVGRGRAGVPGRPRGSPQGASLRGRAASRCAARMKLSAIQRRFLESISGTPAKRSAACGLVTASTRQDKQERLEVYRRAYHSRLVSCLRDLFPALRRALGDEVFTAFAVRYVRDHPPSSYTLGDLGPGFVRFLAPPQAEREPPDLRARDAGGRARRGVRGPRQRRAAGAPCPRTCARSPARRDPGSGSRRRPRSACCISDSPCSITTRRSCARAKTPSRPLPVLPRRSRS